MPPEPRFVADWFRGKSNLFHMKETRTFVWVNATLWIGACQQASEAGRLVSLFDPLCALTRGNTFETETHIKRNQVET
jgi:hypothetical protein